MTDQEIFDHVASHLFTQGERAMSGIGCAYRGQNGTKCAVGCLIPDENYHPRMEKLPVGYREVYSRLPFQVDDQTLALLRRLQTVHDARFPWVSTETMRQCLTEVAKDFDLTLNPELRFSDR